MLNRVESYKCVLTDLKERRSALAEAIHRLDATIADIEAGLREAEEFSSWESASTKADGENSTISRESAAPKSTPPFHAEHKPGNNGSQDTSQTLPQAIVAYLKNAVGPRSPNQIIDALKIAGMEVRSTNPYRLVYNTLWERSRRRNPDVEKVGKGWAYKGSHRDSAVA